MAVMCESGTGEEWSYEVMQTKFQFYIFLEGLSASTRFLRCYQYPLSLHVEYILENRESCCHAPGSTSFRHPSLWSVPSDVVVPYRLTSSSRAL